MEELLRVRTAAKMLDMPRSTVYVLIERGVLRALRLPMDRKGQGFVIRIPSAEVQRFVEEAAAQSPVAQPEGTASD